MTTREQDAWVAKTLGVTIGADAAPAPGAGPRRPAAELLALFNDAKESVDAGLSKLQAALRATGDEDLARIADYGLFGMTGGTGVGLTRALLDLRAAGPDLRDALGAKARAAATAYRDAVLGHRMAGQVDNNPFGVTVGLRATLAPALDAISRSA